MRETTRDSIIGAVAGAAITGVISFFIHVSTQDTMEKKTVETLSQYFDLVNVEMTYEEALQIIYEENKTLELSNNDLKAQLNEREKEITDQQDKIAQYNSGEAINQIVREAMKYGDSANYIQALTLLNSIEIKSPEIEILIDNYSQEYEGDIIEEANILKSNNNLDEANLLITDALRIIPNSQKLKEKKQEIENSYPQNMTEIVPAYQYGGNTYKEYVAKSSGGTEFFTMGGVKYTNGITFNADINIFNDISWAVYYLDRKYSSLEFVLCHVDGTDIGDETFLEIFYDGILKEEISLTPDMAPRTILLDISGVTQLKMQVRPSGSNGPVYGLGNPMIR